MPINLTDLFKSANGDTLIRECGGLLGESAQGISSALDAIVPTLLSAMITKSSSDQGLRSLLDLIKKDELKDVSFHAEDTDELMTVGSGVLSYLFGNQLVTLNDTISSQGGLKTSSASSLLKIVAPLFMGFFARTIDEKSLSTGNVKDLLLSQMEFVNENLPNGLSALPGITNELTSARTSNSDQDMMKYVPPTGMSKFLPWIVLLLTSLGLFYLLQKGCNSPIPPEITPTETRDTI